MKKHTLELFIGLLIVLALMFISGIGCPIKTFTGISCAGCGMTRAFFALLHFQWKDAFYYHPLIYIMPVYVLCFFYWNKFSKGLQRIITTITVILFLGVYLFRLFLITDDIVSIEIEQGKIYKSFILLKTLLIG